MIVSMDKKYKDSDGFVRIICTDAGGRRPVIGIDSAGNVHRYCSDGRYYIGDTDENLDLIEYHEPDIRTIWVNVYEFETDVYDTEVEARKNVSDATIALAIAQPVMFEVKRND